MLFLIGIIEIKGLKISDVSFKMMYMIGLFCINNEIVTKPICINDYNNAVPKLNRLLQEKKLLDYFLPEEKS